MLRYIIEAMHNEDDFKWDSDEDEPETLNVVKKEEDVPETIHVMKKKEDGPEKVPEVAATETSQEITPVKDEDPQREAPVEQATPALPQEDSQSNPDPVETSAPPSLDAFDIVSKESADPELLPSTEEAVEPATKEGQPSSEETQKEDVKDNDWDSWE